MRIVNIEWDQEDNGVFADANLPSEVFFEGKEQADADEIADALSDAYGFCVKSFSIDDQFEEEREKKASEK